MMAGNPRKQFNDRMDMKSNRIKPDGWNSKQQDVFQAVVVAHHFNQDMFGPLSLDGPPVLFPLANNTIIDYTLKWIKLCGVQEVFMFCSAANNQQVRDYINHHWSSEMDNTSGGDHDPGHKMSICVYSSDHFYSVGDMLRDLNNRGILKTDFILIHGDTIGNLPLNLILEDHKY